MTAQHKTEIPLWERQTFVHDSRMTPGLVTLDGYPAVIQGSRNDFAHVARISYTIPYSVEFSWCAVKHIMQDHNGEFVS